MMKRGLVLCMETAVGDGSLALLDPSGSVIAPKVPGHGSRTEELLPAICRALDESKCSVDDIAGIAVSAGPGSFTGIRIGLSTAYGLARGLGAPVFAYSLMKVLAASAAADALIAALIPMGRDAVCIQEFERNGDVTSEIAPPRSIPRGDLTRCISPRARVVAHGSLAAEIDHDDVVDAGYDMAGLIALHFKEYGPGSTAPLFVSKN